MEDRLSLCHDWRVIIICYLFVMATLENATAEVEVSEGGELHLSEQNAEEL